MTWLCHQLGSREHYSIPRALARSGHLGLIQTDAWIRPNWQWLPKAFKQDALANRFHPDLQSARVRSFTIDRVCFDLIAKLRKTDPWKTIEQRDIWFQNRCSPLLEHSLEQSENAVVFSYAYTARKLFKLAKAEGATCVLGQVDPGPGELAHLKSVLPTRISSQIEDRPASYWGAWREEVHLADYLLVNSSWSKELLVSYSEVPENKIEVIPLAYTPESVEEPKQYPERFTEERPLKLLFLGQIIHRKGVHLLLEAMERLTNQPVTLDLVGPTDPNFELQTSNFKLHGPVDREQAKQFYRDSDVFLLPTLSDGFALTQLEAAAHRLPLICSRYCGSVVKNETNGILLEEVSVDSIERTILHCLQNPASLGEWSSHELDWSEYSLEKLEERLTNLVKHKR